MSSMWRPNDLPHSLSTEPIEAWRAWELRLQPSKPVRLKSLFARNIWEQGELEAETSTRCRLTSRTIWPSLWSDDAPSLPEKHWEHSAPEVSCSCGIWAMHSMEQLFPVLPSYHTWPPLEAVYGRVHLSGRIIKTELGYRAQRAKPAELFILPGDREVYHDYELGAYFSGETETKPEPAEVHSAWEVADELADYYGIEVNVLFERDLARAYVARRKRHRARKRILDGSAPNGAHIIFII